jgi:hypothetical protein
MKTVTFMLVGLLIVGLVSGVGSASSTQYGAFGAAAISDQNLTLAAMLTFAIEDEYLARAEYEKVMEKFGVRKPFSNIIKAEEQHIAWLKPLIEKYKVVTPVDRGLEMAQVPDTFSEALKIGVDAEVANIAMYERFLKQELPEDVKVVFEHLLAASKNHLTAFQRNPGNNR